MIHNENPNINPASAPCHQDKLIEFFINWCQNPANDKKRLRYALHAKDGCFGIVYFYHMGLGTIKISKPSSFNNPDSGYFQRYWLTASSTHSGSIGFLIDGEKYEILKKEFFRT